MENASKALLIAASVLIAIVLIAFGVRIFNSTSGTADEVEGTMASAEAAQFNNKFTGHIGNKSKAQVIALLNQVIANNATNSIHTIAIQSSSSDANKDINTFVNSVAMDTKQTYTVKIKKFDDKGYIKVISID